MQELMDIAISSLHMETTAISIPLHQQHATSIFAVRQTMKPAHIESYKILTYKTGLDASIPDNNLLANTSGNFET